MGKGLEIVLMVLRGHREDEKYPSGELRLRDIKYELEGDYYRYLSRQRIKVIVDCLVRKGLVERRRYSVWRPLHRCFSNIKTFSVVN